jgi:hypothetical protein
MCLGLLLIEKMSKNSPEEERDKISEIFCDISLKLM